MTRFNMCPAELGEEVRTQALRLKRRGNTWPNAEEAGPLPVPEFKATRAWLDVVMLYMRGGVRGGLEEGEKSGGRIRRGQPAGVSVAGGEGCSRRTQG